ncbi:hypothetical protein CD798_16985 [Bacillaceae bacterium SAOS 7]|nr:hypothetical protein CD798_16985 [Bacillaceae bacterium SAOS 7]
MLGRFFDFTSTFFNFIATFFHLRKIISNLDSFSNKPKDQNEPFLYLMEKGLVVYSWDKGPVP